jgi:prophage DNA circulation protein
MYQAVSSQSTDPPIHSYISIAARTAMETFQSDIDDVKEDVQELKNGMQTIQKMLQQLIKPTATVKTTTNTEPSGLTASTGGTHGHAGRYCRNAHSSGPPSCCTAKSRSNRWGVCDYGQHLKLKMNPALV